ncbi:MAG: alpha/beta hydrolase [Burkholderiales bacterium]|nr:alpha/beta hydrolase [Burkholderiales bacterium]
MPMLEHDGASIYYEVHGEGFPILTFAPAGLASTIAVWSQPMAPINPISEWSNAYRVIVMDQRNATGGRSRAPITAQDGWHSFASDHIALLDHLKVDQCHLFGQCIGGPFIFSLLKAQPRRIASAIIAQSIGRVGSLKAEKAPRFVAWAKDLKDHPEATEQVLDSFYHNLYDPGFVYSVDRDFVQHCTTPCLVLAGNDEAHPRPISDEIAKLLPNNEYVTEWKEGAPLQEAKARAKAFLDKHTPAH